MDIKLPKLDGFQATHIIKKIRPHLPVVAQSAYYTDITEMTENSKFFDNFLPKPIDKNLLKEIIEKYVPKADRK